MTECGVSVELEPQIISASLTDPPITVNVNSPPITVNVAMASLSASVASSTISVTLADIGQPGPAGPSGDTSSVMSATTAEPISGHFIVTIKNSGLMDYASANNASDTHRPLAMTTGAWAGAVPATATLFGPITEPSWSWTPGLPIWLGDSGLPTQNLPVDAAFQRQVAEVVNSTSIIFSPSIAIVLT